MADEEDQELASQREQERGHHLYSGRFSVPVPDPTGRTVEAVAREVGALKELTFARIDSIEQAIQLFNDNLTRVPTALDREVSRIKESFADKIGCLERESGLVREILQTRFEGADKALKLLQDISDRFPDRIDEKIRALKETHEGVFRSIQKQFDERDTRVDQTAKDTKLAVDAALQAAEKAVQKSELVTSKQIDAQGALISTATDALRETIDDLKQRVIRIESMGVGQAAAKTEQHSSSSLTVSIISGAIAFVAVLFAIAMALIPHAR